MPACTHDAHEGKFVLPFSKGIEKCYKKALQLFEELISVFKGSSRSEKMYYYFAKCYYETDEYATAAYHFNNFTVTYPNSEYAEDAQFMNAFCYYHPSPYPHLA